MSNGLEATVHKVFYCDVGSSIHRVRNRYVIQDAYHPEIFHDFEAEKPLQKFPEAIDDWRIFRVRDQYLVPNSDDPTNEGIAEAAGLEGLEGVVGSVRALSGSPAKEIKRMLSGSADARVIDLLLQHKLALNLQAFLEKTVVFYDFETGEKAKEFKFADRFINQVRNSYLIQDNEGNFIDFETEELIEPPFSQKAISPIYRFYGRYIVSGGNGRTFYDFETGEKIQTFPEEIVNLINVKGKILAHDDGNKTFYDLQTGQKVKEFPWPVGDVHFIANNYFVLNLKERQTLYSFETGKPVLTFPEEIAEEVNFVRGKRIVQGHDGRTFYEIKSKG